jgi:hypothetical protein
VGKTEKKCFCCGQTKLISDFYKHNKMADGHLGKCKACCISAEKKRRIEKADYVRAYEKSRANLPHRIKARAEYQKTEAGKLAHSRAATSWMRRHPNRSAANMILNNAIMRGKVKAYPCFVCGAKAHAHHPDYDRPLDVIWLCPKHHKEAHMVALDANVEGNRPPCTNDGQE